MSEWNSVTKVSSRIDKNKTQYLKKIELSYECTAKYTIFRPQQIKFWIFFYVNW
jgi:hypothetical protein